MPDACKHMHFESDAAVARIEDTGRFMAEVKIRCTECNTPFQFFGMPVGFNFDRAMMSVDQLEAHLPICAQGERPTVLDDGEAMGFEIRAGSNIDPKNDEPGERH